MHDYDRKVNVTGYDRSHRTSQSLQIVSAALAYYGPKSGEVTILVLNKAINVPHPEHNLVSPFQMRLNDVKVNDTPRLLTERPTDKTHTLIVPGAFGIEDELVIPLEVHGVSSVFPTWKPTTHEYDTCDRRYELTYGAPDFDPSDPSFASAEEAMTNLFGGLRDTRGDTYKQVRTLCQMSQACAGTLLQDDSLELQVSALSNTLSYRTFVSTMIANVNVFGVTSSDCCDGVDATILARNWGIVLHAEKRTLKVTTPLGVRTMVHLRLSRRFWMNDRQLRYRCLGIDCFTNTFIAKTESRQKKRCAQVFCTAQGWTIAFPIKLKSEAHHALSLLHSREGVPNIMVMDNSQEQVKGDSQKKKLDVCSHVKQTEPHSQWMNTAEGAICELKKAHGRDMVQEQSP